MRVVELTLKKVFFLLSFISAIAAFLLFCVFYLLNAEMLGSYHK